jgi:hypothetical protein
MGSYSLGHYNVDIVDEKQDYEAVSSVVNLLTLFITSVVLSALASKMSHFHIKVMMLSLFSSWAIAVIRVVYTVCINTILLQQGAIPSLMVIKYLEVLMRYVGVSTNLIMLLTYSYLTYQSGRNIRVNLKKLKIGSFIIMLIYLSATTAKFAVTDRITVSRTFIFAMEKDTLITSQILTIFTFCMQPVSIILIIYSITKFSNLRRIPKLVKLSKVYCMLLASFAFFNTPFLLMLITPLDLTLMRVFINIKICEGIVNSIVIYTNFVSEKDKTPREHSLPK